MATNKMYYSKKNCIVYLYDILLEVHVSSNLFMIILDTSHTYEYVTRIIKAIHFTVTRHNNILSNKFHSIFLLFAVFTAYYCKV